MSKAKASLQFALTKIFSKLKSTVGTLKNKVTRLIQDPKPIVSDLPRWALRRPRAFLKTLLVIGILITGSWIFTRSLDSGYDDPDEFEQIYNLNNWYISLRKSISIHFNLFGTSADSYSNVNAKLVEVLGKKKNLPIIDMENKYIRLSSENVRPGESKITLSVHPNYPNLKDALDKMAQSGLAQFSKSSKVRGEVYSLELALDVYRDGQKINTVAEIFHFRGDKIIERLFVSLIFFSGILAVLYISDLTKPVIYYRAGEVLKAIAALVLEFLNLIKRLIEISDFIPINKPKSIGAPLKTLIEKIIQALENFLARPEKVEGSTTTNQTYSEARRELQEIKISGEVDLSSLDGKDFCQFVYNEIERIQKLVKKLRRSDIRPLRRDDMRDKISDANNALQTAYERLKEIIIELNKQREKKQLEHNNIKENKKKTIADGINSFLNRSDVQQDMSQLNRVFPLEVDQSEIFKTPETYAKGETELISGKLQLTFPFFSFPIPNPECGTDKPIWIKITKTDQDFFISQPDSNKRLKVSPGVVILSITDAFGREQAIEYTVRLKEKFIIKENKKIEIAPENIELSNPKPDPKDWLNKIELPPRPRIVKIN